MKLCWDNLEGMYLNSEGYLKKGTNIYVEEESCIVCGDLFLRLKYRGTDTCSQSCAMKYRCSLEGPPFLGRKHSDSYINKMRMRTGENNPFFGKIHSDRAKKKISDANKGRVMPREVVERLANARRGKKLSYEHRKKISNNHINVSGENNPNWKGGITSESMRIRTSKKYDIWRYTVYKRDDYTCQICWKNRCKIVAHHIKPFSKYKNERFNVANGITLCKKCHTNIHKKWGYKYGEI